MIKNKWVETKKLLNLIHKAILYLRLLNKLMKELINMKMRVLEKECFKLSWKRLNKENFKNKNWIW